MIVCDKCLMTIESHEGNQFSKKIDSCIDEEVIVYGDYDDEGNIVVDEYGDVEAVWCEWCKEYVPYEEAYII